jgi:hypothetical protein
MPGLTLIILAAGIGRRYGGNKQVQSVGPNGEFILHYSVFDALRSGFEHIILVTRPELQEILHHEFQHRSFPASKISYIYQDTHTMPEGVPFHSNRLKPWGTAHAVWVCHDVVKAPFAVINADDFYGHKTFALLAGYLSVLQNRDRFYGLVGFPLHKTLSVHGSVSRAICKLDSSGFLTSIKEQANIFMDNGGCYYLNETGESTPVSHETCVSMNCWAFTPIFLQDLEQAIRDFISDPGFDILNSELYLPNIVGHLLSNQKGKIRVIPNNARWFGITYPQDCAAARDAILDLIRSGIYPVDFSQAFNPP